MFINLNIKIYYTYRVKTVLYNKIMKQKFSKVLLLMLQEQERIKLERSWNIFKI